MSADDVVHVTMFAQTRERLSVLPFSVARELERACTQCKRHNVNGAQRDFLNIKTYFLGHPKAKCNLVCMGYMLTLSILLAVVYVYLSSLGQSFLYTSLHYLLS